ncbi:hypothetical protein [Fluviicola sp.]|uniref:hypothetical protein n=1 Tax=Fluviicola sp. TaxID=1917219 RepID=UPI003D272B07
MSENYTEIDQEVEKNPKRPVLLTVLCILSFISTGGTLLVTLPSMLMGQPSPEKIENDYNVSVQAADDMRDRQMTFMADMIEQAAEVTAYQQHHFWTVMSLNLLASAIGLVGALFMFRGRKLGFHLYIIYCLTSIGSIFLTAPSHMVSMASVIIALVFSGLFIFLYSRSLKWMTK